MDGEKSAKPAKKEAILALDIIPGDIRVKFSCSQCTLSSPSVLALTVDAHTTLKHKIGCLKIGIIGMLKCVSFSFAKHADMLDLCFLLLLIFQQ